LKDENERISKNELLDEKDLWYLLWYWEKLLKKNTAAHFPTEIHYNNNNNNNNIRSIWMYLSLKFWIYE